MDHAAAHERIADLALEAGGLGDLESSAAAEDRALLDHVATCRACQADLAASAALSDALRDALADIPGASAVEPMGAPDSLRAAVLAAAHEDSAGALDPSRGRAAAAVSGAAVPGAAVSGAAVSGAAVSATRGPRRWLGSLRPLRPRWVAGLAAALAIALLGGLAGSQLERQSQEGGNGSLVAAVAALDRVLVSDDHRFVRLHATDGSAAGTVAWSRQDFAVLTSSLVQPSAGRTYRCWLEWGNESASIGVMDFAGGTAFWAGSVGSWAAVAFEPGTRFVVTLEPAADPGPGAWPTSPAILEATLGS